jgi:hypothetical protein
MFRFDFASTFLQYTSGALSIDFPTPTSTPNLKKTFIANMNNKKKSVFKNRGKYTVTANRILIKNRGLTVTVSSLIDT